MKRVPFFDAQRLCNVRGEFVRDILDCPGNGTFETTKGTGGRGLEGASNVMTKACGIKLNRSVPVYVEYDFGEKYRDQIILFHKVRLRAGEESEE